MSEELESVENGLCATCMYLEECAIRVRLGRDALYCDQFVHRAFASGRVSQIKERGLCPACRKRGTCKRAKPEEGVWSCEEFE